MSKLSQLEIFRKLGFPTPPFVGLPYELFERDDWLSLLENLRFPVAVRSSYSEEDGDESSRAGHFHTALNVSREQLKTAVAEVFASYPDREGQAVIIQEMLEPEYSGVLFAFRRGVWKIEFVEGSGASLVGGHRLPDTLLLPRFGRWDYRLSKVWNFWRGVKSKSFQHALIHLSRLTSALLDELPVQHGLDIEFAVSGSRIFLLQARPITTPEEAEWVLTTANHREILPEHPSRLMTALIERSGYQLFEYYRELDPSLPPLPFVRTAAGMPWINLSALLDMMVQWGLPTRLVSRSVGAQDCYQVGIRPWVALRKLPVFWKALRQQWHARARTVRWVSETARRVAQDREQRAARWEEAPELAFRQWCTDFQQLYVDLVSRMQLLTGAMAAPVQVLDRLGWLSKSAAQDQQKSTSTNYLYAFQQLRQGKIDRASFLENFGHRAFYESDLGQPRFREYSESEWKELIGPEQPAVSSPAAPPGRRRGTFLAYLLRPVTRLVHTREWLRHEAMRFFWVFREELQEQFRRRFGPAFDGWSFSPERLELLFNRTLQPEGIESEEKPPSSGWDMDTFLCNGRGRRLSLQHLSNVQGAADPQAGIGIFPGRIQGRVWRVRQAGLDQLQPPSYHRVILVADALDPGWIPFFTEVDGVIAYTGGLLSHASIILREAAIPAITQLPRHIELRNGDYIEMDGQNGVVIRREEDSAHPDH